MLDAFGSWLGTITQNKEHYLEALYIGGIDKENSDQVMTLLNHFITLSPLVDNSQC